MTFFTNIFSNIKALGAMLLGFLALFGLWKYKQKENENEELKSYAEMKDKKAKAMQETIAVQEAVHKQDINNLEMRNDVSEAETEIETKIAKKKREVHATVDKAVESGEFDLKV